MTDGWIMEELESSRVDWNLHAVLDEIYEERQKQDEKWGVQRHPDTMVGYLDESDADEFMKSYLQSGLTKAAQNELDEARAAYEQSSELGVLNWAEILEEEFWEAILEAYKGDKAKLREELIQVAAVAVAWVECLDATNGD